MVCGGKGGRGFTLSLSRSSGQAPLALLVHGLLAELADNPPTRVGADNAQNYDRVVYSFSNKQLTQRFTVNTNYADSSAVRRDISIHVTFPTAIARKF